MTRVLVGSARCETGPQSTRSPGSQFWRENSGAPCVRLETGSLACSALLRHQGGVEYYVWPTQHTAYRGLGLEASLMSISFLTRDNIPIRIRREVCVKCNVCTLHTRLMPQCFTMNLCQRLSISQTFWLRQELKVSLCLSVRPSVCPA